MGLNQTAVLNEKVVEIGAAAIQYSTDSGGSFTGLGAADALVGVETITPLDGEPDNAAKPRRADGVASQTFLVTGNLWENDPAKIAALRGGIDVVTNTAGTPVAGATQTIISGAWAYDVPIAIDGQNADGSAPTINSVTGGTDGLLVVRDDYVLQKDVTTNKYSLIITDSATVTTLAQAMVIDLDYTPAVNVKISTGGIVPADRVWIRIINRTVDAADATVAAELSISVGTNYWYTHRIDIYYCIVNAGKNITYKNKNDTNPTIVVPISLNGESDPDRAAGEDLYEENFFNEVIV